MKIIAVIKYDYDLTAFMEWLTFELKNYILSKVNPEKLERFQPYVDLLSSEESVSIIELFYYAISNIEVAKFNDEFVIHIDESTEYRGINCNLIINLLNDGTLSTSSYPIVSDAFDYFTDNFKDFLSEWQTLEEGI